MGVDVVLLQRPAIMATCMVTDYIMYSMAYTVKPKSFSLSHNALPMNDRQVSYKLTTLL